MRSRCGSCSAQATARPRSTSHDVEKLFGAGRKCEVVLPGERGRRPTHVFPRCTGTTRETYCSPPRRRAPYRQVVKRGPPALFAPSRGYAPWHLMSCRGRVAKQARPDGSSAGHRISRRTARRPPIGETPGVDPPMIQARPAAHADQPVATAKQGQLRGARASNKPSPKCAQTAKLDAPTHCRRSWHLSQRARDILVTRVNPM